MTKETFERQINALVPKPDPQITASLFELGQELGESPECDGVQDLLNSLEFISRHFDAEVLQNAYEIIRCGSPALPGELVTSAVLLQSGGAPESLSELILHGYLLGFYAPKEPDELSPLAVCCIVEDGKLHLTYTEHFGSFDPEKVLQDAREYARQHGTSVLETLLRHTAPDGTISQTVSGKLLSNDQPEVAKAMADIFSRCPAVAAQMMLDACWGITVVERNPLWLELQQRQSPIQGGMEQTM